MTHLLFCQADGGLTVLEDPRPAPELAALLNAGLFACLPDLPSEGPAWLAVPLGSVLLAFHPSPASTTGEPARFVGARREATPYPK